MSLSLSTYLPPQADALFKLLSPLVKDQADQPVEPPDPDDFEEEQMTMACLVDLFRAQEPDQQYMVCVWWGTKYCTACWYLVCRCIYYRSLTAFFPRDTLLF